MVIMGTKDLTRLREKGYLFDYYILQLEKMVEELESELEYIESIDFKVSNTTESTYYIVSFKNNSNKYKFTVRNHRTRKTYRGAKYKIIDYNSIEHLKNAIIRDMELFIA